jgi:hypothetical protein
MEGFTAAFAFAFGLLLLKAVVVVVEWLRALIRVTNAAVVESRML